MDFALAGKKHKHITVVLFCCSAYCGNGRFGYGGFVGVAFVNGFHIEHLGLTRDNRRREYFRKGWRVDCGRHYDDFQVGAEDFLTFAAKGECEFGVEVPFVKLVENDCGYARKFVVGLNHSCENTFCNHLQTCFFAFYRFKPDAVTDSFADFFA